MIRTIVLALFVVLAPSVSPAQRRLPKDPLLVLKPVYELDQETGRNEWVAFTPLKCAHCIGRKLVDCAFCEQSQREGAEGCPSCEGDGKCLCPTCAGEGKRYDPLDFMPCYTCLSSGWQICNFCHGDGKQMITGGSKKGQKCPGCEGAGAHPCSVCDGQRRIEVPKIGGKPIRETPLDKLQKAKQAAEKVQAAIRKFRQGRNASKSAKVFAKAIKPARKDLVFLKDWAKMMKDVSKATEKASIPYTSHDDNMRSCYEEWKWSGQVQMMYVVELLDVCIERAERNAALEAGKD